MSLSLVLKYGPHNLSLKHLEYMKILFFLGLMSLYIYIYIYIGIIVSKETAH